MARFTIYLVECTSNPQIALELNTMVIQLIRNSLSMNTNKFETKILIKNSNVALST